MAGGAGKPKKGERSGPVPMGGRAQPNQEGGSRLGIEPVQPGNVSGPRSEGGIRSPIVANSQGAAFQSMKATRVGQQPGAGAAGHTNAGTKAGVPPAAAVEKTDEFQPIQFRSVERGGYRNFVLGTIGLIVAAFATLYFFFPQKWRTATDKIAYTYFLVVEKIPYIGSDEHGKLKTMYKLRVEDTSPLSGIVPGSKEAANLGWDKMDCRFLIEEALYRKQRGGLDAAGRTAVAECYLIKNAPRDAIEVVGQFGSPPPSVTGPKTIQQVDAFLTLIAAKLDEWRFAETDAMTRSLCPSWSASPGCIGKLLVTAESPFLTTAESGFQTLQMIGSRFGARAQAYVWLAGGRAAMNGHRYPTAEARFVKAFKLAPAAPAALRMDILDARMENAYYARNIKVGAQTASLARATLGREGPAAYRKADFIYQLLGPDAASALMAFLADASSTSALSGDRGLFRIVSYEAVRLGLSKNYIPFLSQVRLRLARDFKVPPEELRDLDYWEVRTMISLNRAPEAYKKVSQLVERHGEDALSHHLRGIALMGISPATQYQKMAALEFQKAVQKKVNWQSLYALGVSLLHAGMLDQAAQAIKSMSSLATDAETQKWVAMLKMENLLAQGRAPLALSNVERYLQQDPRSLEALLLKKRILTKLRRNREVSQLDEIMDKQGLREGLWTTLEARHHPLGPFALLP